MVQEISTTQQAATIPKEGTHICSTRGGRPPQVRFATHFFDTELEPVSPPQFLLTLRQIDKITAMPTEYMLVARSSLLLRGLATKLHCPQRMSDAWVCEARRYLREFEAAADPTGS